MNKRAVILISGGLDSAVTAFIAKQESNQLYGLSFLYGQKHNREIDSAKKIGNAFAQVAKKVSPAVVFIQIEKKMYPLKERIRSLQS